MDGKLKETIPFDPKSQGGRGAYNTGGTARASCDSQSVNARKFDAVDLNCALSLLSRTSLTGFTSIALEKLKAIPLISVCSIIRDTLQKGSTCAISMCLRRTSAGPGIIGDRDEPGTGKKFDN